METNILTSEILLKMSLILLAAGLTAWLAVHTYFRQREHELILSRYLEGCLDLLASEVAQAHEAVSHNWSRALAILKSYRDLEERFDAAELSSGFVELQAGKHNIVAHYRLYALTGTYDYWIAYQHAMAHFASANSKFVKEIPEAIRLKLSDESYKASHKRVRETCLENANKENDQSHEEVELVSEFLALSENLEKERYRFKNLYKFREKSEVKKSMARVRAKVAELGDEPQS